MDRLHPLIFAWCALVATIPVHAQTSGYESFENGIPDYMKASRPDSLRVNGWHSKHGGQSLRWDWHPGESVVIRHDIGDVQRRKGFLNKAAFSLWMHLEKPLDGALVFEFREGERVRGIFRFPMQFSGWRTARLHYDAFPGGAPTSEVDNIRISCPPDGVPGAANFDLLGYNLLTYPSASINPETLIPRQATPYLDEKLHPRILEVSEAELAGFQKLKGPPPRTRKATGIPGSRVEELHSKMLGLKVFRDEHGVHGPGIDGRSYYCAEAGEYGGKDVRFWPDELGPEGLVMAHARPFNALAMEIAQAYHASTEEPQRRQLSDDFLLLADYLEDQGESLDAAPLTSMREILSRTKRFDFHFEALVRSRGGDTHFVANGTALRSNMDFYSHYARNLMDLCMIPPDPAVQVRWMNAWAAMMERSLSQPSGAFKVDGAAYHHGGHYHSYAQGAFANFAKFHLDLQGTPWRLSAAAHEQLRRAMLAQRLYANRVDLPLSLKGRSPFWPDYGVILPYGIKAFDTLARLGSPDGKESVDREVAAAYLRLDPGAAQREPYRSLDVKAEPEPNGTFVMPYACLLAHRRDDWLVCVRGQSRYCWGSERQARRNCFGPFMSFGSLEILSGGKPVSARASGIDGAGWDWARFAGTTAPQLPMMDLEKAWPQGSEVTRSPETFVGGLSHLGRQGVFTMVVNQTVTPEGKSLQGRRSWFFNEDRILCMASGITSDLKEYPTQTTLCQQSLQNILSKDLHPTWLDGAEIRSFPEDRTLSASSAHWFCDVQQTGYYVPKGHKVTVARQHQKSRDVNDWEDTSGDFVTAWIDHGKAPAGAEYEYLVRVRSTPQAMRETAARPPYRVLARNARAHVMWDIPGRRFGCVFFEAQAGINFSTEQEALPVCAVDRPCLLMTHAAQKDRLALSVCDPDLHLQPGGRHEPKTLRVTLRGAWRLESTRATTCVWPLPEQEKKAWIASSTAAETVLEILCEHGASYDLMLAR